jgi:hypothetical protein
MTARTLQVKELARTLLVFGVADSALAVGTAAGTSVDNLATVDYNVGGTPQALIESSPTGNNVSGAGNGTDTTFLVDDMVDLTVVETDAAYRFVVAGATAEVLTFTLTNTGNETHDFSFTTSHTADPFGGTDNFNATSVAVFADENGNGTYEPGTDVDDYADELTADASVAVFIVHLRAGPGGAGRGGRDRGLAGRRHHDG